MGSFPLDFLRRFMRRRPARPPRLTLEEYEERIVPISSLSNYDLVWPTGGNPPTTRTSHPGNGIDINQDSDEGDTGSSDAGALVIAGHGGYATKVVNSVYYSDYPTETPTYGNYVVVSEYRDGTGIKTLYAHLKEVAPEFLTASTKNPIAVYQGQTLGSLGNTGTSTDHHLHYEVKYDNAPALYSGAADALLHSHPTYFKGFMDASNKLVVSQHPDQLASRLFSFALPYQPRFAPVVMARPNDDLQFQLKGYDWNEEIFLRLRNETGGSVPVNVVGGGSNPFFTGGWDFDGLDNNAGDGRDDPSRPNDAGQDDGRQAPTEITIRVPSTPGYYLLEGLERNPRYLTGIDNTSNSDVYALTQATGVWPSQAIGEPNAAYSMPVILLITADAPAHGFRSQIATMRSSSIPPTIYTVDTDRVLLVPGSHTTDDTITLEKSGTQYVLTVNGTVSSFQDSDFNAVFVAPGGGNNVVDLRDVAASKRVTVIGGDGIDIILGGPGNDVLVGGAGADWIEGGGGNDWVFGNDGSDTLFSHTSARRSLFSNEHTTRDNLFGEADTDQLFSRRGDVVYGGSTDDTFYGRQGERGLNTYVAWGANQIPVGIGDTILLVGDEVGNQFTIKPPQAGVRLVDMDGFTFPLTDAAFRRYVRMLALPGGGPDTVDLRNSPIPARVFAVGGNDTVYGTAQGDTISGGIGDDVLYGERGNDRIGGKAGNDTIRGGANDDELYGDAGEDDIDGGTEKDYIDGRLDGADDHAADRLTGNGQSTIILGVSDVNLRPGPDLQVIQPGQTAPANRPVVIDSYLVASAGEALPSRAAPVESESRAAVQISSFTVTPSLVPRGDSALFTLRTTGTGTSARLTLVHDRNNNGVYDAPDAIIARYRPAAGGLRGQIGTENFMPGVVKVLPVLDFSDGSVVVGPAIPFTVQDQLAALLPPGIAVMPDDVLSLIPHRNGDVTVVGNVLAGRGQIDVWEITPRATGAFRFWTTGSTDTVVALYNAAGQRIGDPDDDSGPGVNGEILATLAADTTYYFAVACKTPDGGGYDLRVTGVNQTVAATIDTPPGAFTGSATGTITVTHRLDYLQLVAPAGATLLDVAIETDPSLAVWVRVADSNSTVIGFAQPGRAGLDQVLTRLPVQGGRTYYVTIFGLYGTAGDYTAAADFYPDEVGLPLTTTIPLLGEYEQLIVGADGDVTLGGQAIDTPGQFRTYIISPTTSGEFVIQTTGSTDTMLAVYTGSGSQRLGWSDNDGGGGNARVTLDLTGGQDYIVKIRGAGTATGPFAVRVNGADQFRRPITIAGRSYLGDDVASVAGNARQMYFSAVAPPAATTLNMSLTALSGSTFDGWFSIQDEAGIRTVVNTVGINTVDSIANFPVQGGKTYLFTVFGWNETTGSARLGLDFNPNVSGGGEIPLATTTFDTQRNPHVAVAPDGRAVAVWIGYKPNGASGDYEVYGQRFDARGEAVGPEFLVNVDDTQDQEFATVAVDASGNFVVAWRTNGVVSARVYDAAGTPTGPEFLAGISAQQGLAVAKQPGGSFLLVGGQSTQLVGRLFNPSGSPAGAAFVIDPNHANNVSVAADGQGRYVLAWTRTQGASVAVYAARYSAAGALVTPLFPVAPALATSQFESSVDAAASGAFVVAFRSFDGGPTGNDVYFQRFAADASPLGVLTRPHEFTTGTQDVPSVAMKDNTEVVVAWQSPNPQGGTGTEVYARHYDAAGNPADPQETRINEYTPNDQSRPRIATNGQQRFGLVWQSYMPAGSVDDVVGLFMDFATPTPRPVLRVTESAGTPDDAALPFGSYLQNAPNPTQVVRVSNLGTTNLTGTAALAGGGAFALIGPATFDLAPGQFQDYTVVLSTAARGSFTSTLTITSNSAVGTVPVAVTATVVPPPDANEPNESAPAATNLGVVSVLSRTNLTLHRDQDEDWYVFTVARPSVLTVFTSFSHSEGDLDILLLDQHFGVLAAAASQVDQESMSVAVPGGQLLYLKAVAVGAAADVYDLHIQEITAPTADIRDVGPDPRASGVGTILFDFSEPVTGFDVSDLVLTRNGTAVALTGATLTTTGNMTWTVGNVSGLTALDGVYELSLTGTGSGIADSAGNPFTDTVTDTWVMDTTTTTAVSAPAITYGAAGAVTVTVGSTLGTPDGTIQLIVDGTSTYTGTLSAGAHTFAVGVLGAGTHTLSANYLGSATWQPSTTAGSLLVNRAALTLAADAQSKVYGAALPTLTFTTSGLVNGDTPATALAGAPTTTATAASGVGAYPVTIGTLAAANYAVTFTDSTLTVTAASLAATPTSGQTKVYGANLPVLAYTTAGLVNGDTPAAVLSGLLGSTATAASVVGTYAITGGTLAANANYTLTITPGVTLAVTPAPLTVAADPKSKVYGAALPALTFTTSGLVNGDTAASALTGALATTAIAASGVGAYPITWGTLAAANYTLSITDSSLSVTPAALTVVADAKSKVYGAVVPTLTFTTSGFVNGDTPASALTGAPATTATAASGVGGYSITTGTLAAPNYAVTFTDNTLTVTPAALTVAADALSKVYGAALPTLTFTTSGFVNGDTAASALTGALATTATAASGVGAYPVTIGTLAAPNYAISFADGTLAVTRASLAVTPTSGQTKVYGANLPVLTYTTAGLVNGDTPAAVLSGSLGSTATAASAVGSYAITDGTLATNANYTLTVTPGVTLAVTPAALTVMADPKSKVYGAALPTLTFTTSGLVNGDTAASALAGAPATTATAASGVGAYPVTSGTLAAPNYAITFTDSSLSVTPAPLTVAAGPKSMTYGGAFPALTFTTSGLVNGDTAGTVLTGALATSATAASSVNTYPVTQGTLSVNANYALSFDASTLTITKAPLTVFVDPKSKVYGAALPALTYQVAGLVNGDTAAVAVTLSLTTAATAASGVGAYPITAASPPAAANYEVAVVGGTLSVVPAALAVTAVPRTKLYGAAVPALTFAVAGLVNGDTPATALTGGLTSPAAAGSPTGSYPIDQGSLAAANYAVTYATGALTVTPAPLSVTAGAASKVYGAALPSLTFAVTGLVNGDTASGVLAGALGTTGTAASPVGEYAVTRTSLTANGNYAITAFTDGRLTVTPAPLAVTADAATKVYGAALPTLSYSVAGLVNGDVPGGALTGAVTTPASPASGVGSYPITRGSLAAANYAVAFTDALLLVTPAPLAVVADNAESLAGVTLPPFTYTVTGLVNGDGPAVVTGVTLATAATTASPAGAYPITAAGGRADNYTVSAVPGVVTLRPSFALLGTTAFAVGADGGAAVRAYNPDGTPGTTPPALGDGFAGGVRATTADVTGDNTPDLIVGTGPGRTAEVRVFDGATGRLMSARAPFADFQGGVFVSSGDFNQDGFADIVVTPDEGGGPRVSIYSGKDGAVLLNFFAIDDPNFRGGARAAAGDVNGDGTPDLVVSAGFGGGPRIAVYDGKSLGGMPTKLMNDFFAFEQGLRNGAYVAVGDLTGDGKAELIFGGGPGGGPRVLALDAVKLMRGDMPGATLLNFFAGNENNRGGVRVAAKNLDGDAKADLVVGDGAGAGSRVTTYLGKLLGPGTPPSEASFDAFPGFLGGVFVG